MSSSSSSSDHKEPMMAHTDADAERALDTTSNDNHVQHEEPVDAETRKLLHDVRHALANERHRQVLPLISLSLCACVHVRIGAVVYL